MSGRKIVLALLLGVLGIVIGFVSGPAAEQIPEEWKPFLGLEMLAALVVVFLVVSVLYEIASRNGGQQSNSDSQGAQSDGNGSDPLVVYLQELMRQVRDLNLSGIDPSLAADPKRSRLLLSAVYVDLQCQQAASFCGGGDGSREEFGAVG